MYRVEVNVQTGELLIIELPPDEQEAPTTDPDTEPDPDHP